MNFLTFFGDRICECCGEASNPAAVNVRTNIVVRRTAGGSVDQCGRDSIFSLPIAPCNREVDIAGGV
jgi:hypothetical protein